MTAEGDNQATQGIHTSVGSSPPPPVARVTVIVGLLLGATLSSARANGEPTPAPEDPAASPTSGSASEPPASGRIKVTGLELGFRTGYGLPTGSVDGSTPMQDMVTGVIPLWFDVGYRATPNLYGGVYFQYGFGSLNTDSGKPESPCASSMASCSTNDLRTGVEAHLHFAPDAPFDPWLGAGLGVEVETFSVSGPGGSASVKTTGAEYLNLQLGMDWNISPELSIGPFASFSIDQYDSIAATLNGRSQTGGISDKRLHEWFVIGVRTAYDITLRARASQ